MNMISISKAKLISIFCIRVVILLAIFVMFGGVNTEVFAQVKLGYVDSQLIIEKSADAQSAQKQLAELNNTWQEEVGNKEAELKRMQEELEAKQLMLSEQAIKEKQAQMQNLYLEYQQFQQTKWGPQGELQQEQTKLMEPIIKKINETIKKVGIDEGYDYIFDLAAGNIVHVSASQVNLTEKVITELSKPVPK